MSILNRIDGELKEDEDVKLTDKQYMYGQSIAAEICNFGGSREVYDKTWNKQHHIQIPNA